MEVCAGVHHTLHADTGSVQWGMRKVLITSCWLLAGIIVFDCTRFVTQLQLQGFLLFAFAFVQVTKFVDAQSAPVPSVAALLRETFLYIPLTGKWCMVPVNLFRRQAALQPCPIYDTAFSGALQSSVRLLAALSWRRGHVQTFCGATGGQLQSWASSGNTCCVWAGDCERLSLL